MSQKIVKQIFCGFSINCYGTLCCGWMHNLKIAWNSSRRRMFEPMKFQMKTATVEMMIGQVDRQLFENVGFSVVEHTQHHYPHSKLNSCKSLSVSVSRKVSPIQLTGLEMETRAHPQRECQLLMETNTCSAPLTTVFAVNSNVQSQSEVL